MKCEAQKILCEWLETTLPNLANSADWKKYVEEKVTISQRSIIMEEHYRNLKQLDFAMLLNIIRNNWNFLKERSDGLRRDHRTYVEEMVNARNRWSHKSTEAIETHSPDGICNDDRNRDIDTIKRFIEPLNKNHSILEKIRKIKEVLINPPVSGSPTTPPVEMPTKEEKEKNEIKRVKRKIPTWFNHPQQKNSTILIEFLKANENGQGVHYNTLRDKCPLIPTFQSNYVQMKDIRPNNHAKVFEESEEGVITLWSCVAEFVLEEYQKYRVK